jgi:hypoxanthine phosphoribosyltransferase
MGAARVHTAVLADKEIQKTKPVQADFVGLKVPDRFVFGCGMDAYGLWRNLPEIRALKAE